MSTATEERITSVADLGIVVSTDEHISESVSDLLPYVSAEYSGIRTIIEQSTEPWREIFSVTPPLPPFSNTPMASDYGGADGVMEGGDGKLETKLLRLDNFDIDHGILNPTLMAALPTVQNPQAAVALATAYNEWLYEEFASQCDRLSMSIVVPGQDPDVGVEEIEKYAGKDEVVAVQMNATGHRIPLSHEWWFPVYEAAERHGIPVAFHSSFPALAHGFPSQQRWHTIFAQDKVISHPFSHMWNLTKMIYEGIPERFPGLNFVIQEAGIGWIPYWRMRLDRYAMGLGEEMPMLTKLPGEYIDDQFYFTTQPVGHSDRNPQHIPWLIEMAGPQNIMYSADIPHSDFDPPEELLDPVKSHFDAETVRGMMGETAVSVFDLDV